MVGTRSLAEGMAQVRALVLDDESLVRAVGSGRRRSATPAWRRVELRWVDLKAGRHLQITRYDATQAHTANHLRGAPAAEAVDALLAEPFGNWTLSDVREELALRVTKKGDAVVHTKPASAQAQVPARSHDRAKERLLADDDPVFAALGMSDTQGRIKPSRMAKYRQVEDFLRILDASIAGAREKGRLRRGSASEPLRIVDLGCGNGYLTFAAHRYLSAQRGLAVQLIGVDTKEQSRAHNTMVAEELGIAASWVAASIDAVDLASLPGPPDVVLALHACDTATDDALARAVQWQTPLVLAAPCCHHDIAAQLRRVSPPAPYASLVRDGILRERFADTLTDAVRASLLRRQGYRVDVMEFVDSQHTPRNTLLRAVRTPRGGDADAAGGAETEYDELVAAWGIRPRLGQLLGA
ncbi:MAG: SAM-dependent methyltransferase [Nocardioidaceae bacterium]|nr:SAM-dependent methyltransferase [Nocardioidaceae bacterium]